MPDVVREMHGVRVLACGGEGALLDDRSANDFISAAWEHDAELIAVPVARIDPRFFDLSTRVAGEAIQKLVNYQLRLAVVGDISAWTAESRSLRDFVREADGGRDVCFVQNLDDLERRLSVGRL